MRILYLFLVFAFLVLSIAGPYKAFKNYQPLIDDTLVYIDKGDSMEKVLTKVAPISFVNKALFKLFITIESIENFKVGEYKIHNKKLEDLFISFNKGDTFTHKFTVIEGSNIYELQEEINRSSFNSDCSFLNCINTNYPFKEGILLPETYFYKKNVPASLILQKSHNSLDSILSKIWLKKPIENPLKNKFEALVLASIIEKEAGNNNEKSLIAGVFLKRMNLGMRLQADPTIIYGLLPNFNGDIKKSDILNKKNLYNTYMIKGLPPTPISNASISSIEAAILSTPGDFLFFVADSPRSHYFSKTYDEHLMMIKKLGLDK